MAAAAYFYPVEALSDQERERLIIEHIPQVRLIARKLHERLPDTIMLEDLFSAGVIGLINAIDNFDPRQNVKLRTYAEFRIRGAMLDSLRESDWAPRLKRRLARELEAGLARVEQRLGRVAEESEIAAELKMSVETYRQNLNDVAALDIGELEFLNEGQESSGLLRYVATPDEDSPALKLERRELERLIASSIDMIPKVEKTVLSLYFYEELNLREIGEIMGLHFSRVSQIKTQAILRLRNAIGKQWPGLRGREHTAK
ncbi:MAG: FliA/WhiG family RNA polymerase sigma factor [Acidobacteriota bacterium]|nr:FliA/WhiG family RNA polymerase sigma factor [Acidobacteriota bacterium]